MFFWTPDRQFINTEPGQLGPTRMGLKFRWGGKTSLIIGRPLVTSPTRRFDLSLGDDHGQLCIIPDQGQLLTKHSRERSHKFEDDQRSKVVLKVLVKHRHGIKNFPIEARLQV